MDDARETLNLVAVLGAVDEALVQADEAHYAAAAALLGAYQHDGAVGWYQNFVDWLRRIDPEAEQLPSLPEALDALGAAAHEGEPRGWWRSKRLLALAALARSGALDPGGQGADLEALVTAALRPLLAEGSRDEDRAAAFLDFLRTGPDGLAPGSSWSAMVREATDHGLDPEIAEREIAPCQGEIIEVGTEGDLATATTLKTHFCTTEITLDELKPFLDPQNWPTCSGFWQEMTRLNPGRRPRRYLERVGLGGAFTLRTCLEFVTTNLNDAGTAVAVEYRLSADQSRGDGHVLVDEGSIVAEQKNDQLCITTTKRVRFDGPFDGPSMALLLCALGYLSASEDMIYTCAKPRLAGGGAWEPDPPAADQRAEDIIDGGSAVPVVLQNVADAVATGLRSCADAFSASYSKALGGTYTANEWVSDVAAMWSRAVTDLARIASGALRPTRPGGPPPGNQAPKPKVDP